MPFFRTLEIFRQKKVNESSIFHKEKETQQSALKIKLYSSSVGCFLL